MDSRLLTTASNLEARVSWPGCCIWCTGSETGLECLKMYRPCNCCSSITVLTFWQNLLSCRSRLALCLQLLIALLYGYIAATYTFMLMFTALSIQQQGGEKKMKKKQPAILLHHNHYGPFHMGERNFIIVPAGTVKSKLMNTESFLLRGVVSLQCRCWGILKATFLIQK